MRIHSLQHVEFEDLGNIASWALAKGHSVAKTLLCHNEKLPSLNKFDWLIVMGGPMNVYEEEQCPWLIQEKKLIGEAIAENKVVLGICLGAQLIADVLGAQVSKNAQKEIGWHSVYLTEPGKRSSVFSVLPDAFIAFHWHGDTFELPAGVTWIAKSEGCVNQVFEYDGRVFGLQFHLESSEESIHRLADNCGHELTEGKYIQTKKIILQGDVYLQQIEKLIVRLLDQIEHEAGRRWEEAC